MAFPRQISEGISWMFTPKLWGEPQLASFWLAVKSLPIHVTHTCACAPESGTWLAVLPPVQGAGVGEGCFVLRQGHHLLMCVLS